MIARSVKFRDHPCFKTEWAGFDDIKPVNIIIGRNNTGKSHLLDLVQILCSGDLRKTTHEYLQSGVLDKELLQRHFRAGHTGPVLQGDEWEDHAAILLGKAVWWKGHRGGVSTIFFEDPELNVSKFGTQSLAERNKRIEPSLINPGHMLNGYPLRRLAADRDIYPELVASNLEVMPDGTGATNVIRHYLTRSSARRELIREDLRDGLNVIFGPDGDFTEITVQEHDDRTWEVYLVEKEKGRVALSKSGSGLKTIILVLLKLIVEPALERTPDDRGSVFAFEELENNLHPSLLRRLLRYIEEFTRRKQNQFFFLTTHSSVTLDVFGGSESAQIVRVTHDGKSGRSETVSLRQHQINVLSELGGRPSDILLSNCAIWVEGPSDRIYLKKWIELISDGELREGRDYLCIFYGGSLLARLCAGGERAVRDLVDILGLNHRVIMVCDSDRSSPDSALKHRVQRISDELANTDALVWITAGKEIENYIPGHLIAEEYEKPDLPDPGQFESFWPSAEGDGYFHRHTKLKTVDKGALASVIAPRMTRENMAGRLDWSEMMKSVVEKIRRWNE